MILNFKLITSFLLLLIHTEICKCNSLSLFFCLCVCGFRTSNIQGTNNKSIHAWVKLIPLLPVVISCLCLFGKRRDPVKYSSFHVSMSIDITIVLILFMQSLFHHRVLVTPGFTAFPSVLQPCSLNNKCISCDLGVSIGMGLPHKPLIFAFCQVMLFCEGPYYFYKEIFLG